MRMLYCQFIRKNTDAFCIKKSTNIRKISSNESGHNEEKL